MKKIKIPDKPTHMATAIVAYAGIAKRLYVELGRHAGASGVDLEAIKSDLIREAKKAILDGDFVRDEIGVYETMFEAIETVFEPLE